MKRIFSFLIVSILLTGLLSGCGIKPEKTLQYSSAESYILSSEQAGSVNTVAESEIAEDGSYTSKEEVKEYLINYGKLPPNFVSKKEAREAGWDSKDNYISDVLPGKSIGGDRFGNYEKLLPEKKGRIYYEADIDYIGGKRNAKRIVYSNDGLIYYTDNHYKSFELLYGEE